MAVESLERRARQQRARARAARGTGLARRRHAACRHGTRAHAVRDRRALSLRFGGPRREPAPLARAPRPKRKGGRERARLENPRDLGYLCPPRTWMYAIRFSMSAGLI